MTKNEFCEKWKHGCNEHGFFYNRETMMHDLDSVIHNAIIGWKKFVDRQVEVSIDLDEWQRQEAEAIQKRQCGN